jgi:HK97 family phage portal protein
MGLFNRSIRPPAEDPNGNDPVTAAPNTVGPPGVNPGDPHGVTLDAGDDNPGWFPPRITPSPWSGWPAEWSAPYWSSGGGMQEPLTDTAWMCIDFNANQLSTMPPYLKNGAPTLSADWLNNPDPDCYTSWEEFAKQLFWDYQAVGEAFVLTTARYSTGWPARFHVVPPWWVSIDMVDGERQYRIGDQDVTEDLLHVRYQSQVGYAHGVGPLEVGRYRMVAAQMLIRYGTKLAAGGGIPAGVLQHPAELTPDQATTLQAQWVQSRLSQIGEPAVLSGGLTWTPTQINPTEMALTSLLDREEGRIAHLLGVPSELVGIPTSTDPMTYKNVTMWFDMHWRSGLRPKAQHVMSALSGWALPRGTTVELNRDEYVAAEPLERAQTAQILNSIVDPKTGQPALSVQEIRDAERLDNSTPSDVASGVLR